MIDSNSHSPSSYISLPFNSNPPGSLTPLNLIKFRGVKLPGGLELNGREIYDDGQRELDAIKQKMQLEYELPPLDLSGRTVSYTHLTLPTKA